METKDLYDEAVEKYLKEGINYNANTINKADQSDLEQLAADSFWYGYRFAMENYSKLIL